ncbi:MAG: anhydro-N-acetylmuramic acid kinase [Gammaproteobacteria bacterium]|nr:anhydro-N-acetylmuramic acid kinase [Gammaproteobacteria bacterium]
MPRYLGLLSGTSADAVDAALVEIDTTGTRLLAARTEPLPEPLHAEIHALAAGSDGELARAGHLGHALGEVFAKAAIGLLGAAGQDPAGIRAIGCHGQTLRHEAGGQHPFSLQVGDAALVARRTGIPTVADFRSADLAVGGQGAPLAPAFHAAALAGAPRVILNLGGIANVTLIRDENRVTGFDTGPANTLLDGWMRRRTGQSFDRDGAFAASGQPSPALLERLLADPFFSLPPPRSTGPDYFSRAWLDLRLEAFPDLAAADVAATLVAFSARSVRDALEAADGRGLPVFACGGGVHNPALMAALEEELGTGQPLTTTAALGMDPDWVEAMAFAWLAHRRLEGLPGNLPAVTGAREAVVLGAVYSA